jgi:hypothetical protein
MHVLGGGDRRRSWGRLGAWWGKHGGGGASTLVALRRDLPLHNNGSEITNTCRIFPYKKLSLTFPEM